jgi:hypothetical protein
MFLHTTGLFTITLLGLGIATAPSATAIVEPPTGSLSCAIAGTVVFRPALPDLPSRNAITARAHYASVSACDASGVSGGRAEINDGDATLSMVFPAGADCANVGGASSFAAAKPAITVKLTNTTVVNGRSSETTVATIRPTVTVLNTNGVWTFTGTIAQNKRGDAPFGGERFSATLAPKMTTAWSSCALHGVHGVWTLPFDATLSSVTITP